MRDERPADSGNADRVKRMRASAPRVANVAPRNFLGRSADDLLSHLEWDRPSERARGAPGLPTDDPGVLERLDERLNQFAMSLNAEEIRELHSLLRRVVEEDGLADLASTPAEQILTPDELSVLRELEAESRPAVSGLHPEVHLIVKLTRRCNLRCTYCNYWRPDSPPMSFGILARLTRDVLLDPGVREVKFIWHGGEPTLLPFAYYRKWLWLQEHFRRPDQLVRNRVQTNAVNLGDEWIAFIRRYRLIVGVSLDGPPELNDKRRVTLGGKPTAALVRSGIKALYAAGIEPRVNMVVDADVVECGAGRVLDYFLEVGVTRVGLLNVVPENTIPGEALKNAYLPFPAFVQFMRDLFHLWWPSQVDKIVLREIADLTRQMAGLSPIICNFAGECFGLVYTIEPDGDFWCACDRYVGSDEALKFGNIARTPIGTVERSGWYRDLVDANARQVDFRRDCRWFSVCHGGCPHDYKMSRQWLSQFGAQCCGLAPLLDDIAAALEKLGVPVPDRGKSDHRCTP